MWVTLLAKQTLGSSFGRRSALSLDGMASADNVSYSEATEVAAKLWEAVNHARTKGLSAPRLAFLALPSI